MGKQRMHMLTPEEERAMAARLDRETVEAEAATNAVLMPRPAPPPTVVELADALQTIKSALAQLQPALSRLPGLVGQAYNQNRGAAQRANAYKARAQQAESALEAARASRQAMLEAAARLQEQVNDLTQEVADLRRQLQQARYDQNPMAPGSM